MLPAVRSHRRLPRALTLLALALTLCASTGSRADTPDPLDLLSRLPLAPERGSLPDLGVVTRQVEADIARRAGRLSAESGRVAAPATLVPTAGWSDEPNTVGRYLGAAVSPAGDVNADGFSDFVALGDVGSFNTALYLYFGSASGPTLAPGYPVTNLPLAGPGNVGVNAAGDVNGDGFGDIVLYWPITGHVRVYFGGTNGFDLVTYNSINGHFGTNMIGFHAAPAGDIDNDGYDDLIFGMPTHAGFFPCTPQASSGVAEVLYGSASGVSSTVNWYLAGCNATGAGARLGASVAGAGDVNGDGFADVVIGAPGAQDFASGTTVGKVYVMYGAADRLPRLSGFANLGSVHLGSTIIGQHALASFGHAVAAAGDANGDGYADIAIGAPTDDIFVTDGGTAHVFRGSAAGVDSAHANVIWWDGNPTTNAQFGLTLAPAGDVNGDGLADLLLGEQGGLRLAQSGGSTLYIEQYFAYDPGSMPTCTAGDVNGDGLSDLLVGERMWSNTELAEGRVFIHYGLGSPPSTYANWVTSQSVIDNPNLGWSVASAGDVNGDGYDDVIVGAPTWYNWLTPGSSNNGLIMLFYGHATGISTSYDWYTFGANEDQLGVAVASAGDLNGDGYGDLIVGAHTAAGGLGEARIWYGSALGVNNAPNLTLTGVTSGGYFGGAVACAGDVDGDGYPDVIVGAPNAVDPSTPLTNEGRAYVYRGGSGGLNPALHWSISGGQANAHLGTSVAGAGDVNGDSYGDIVIGSPDYDATGKFGVVTTDAGRAIVVYGSVFGPNLTLGLNVFSPWRMGASVAGAGDVNGDGYSDIVLGAPNGTNTFSGEGAARVYAGGPGYSMNPLWTQYGGENFGGFGSAVSSAGDVDGDGLSDVLVGAVFQDMGGPQDQGRAYVFRGPLTAGAAAFWYASGGSSFANMGHALANAGDVNGDGWSDLIFGMPGYNGTGYRQGYCQVHLGAGARGRNQITVPFRIAPATRIVHSGNLSDPGQFLLLGHGRSAAGRAKVRMQYKVTSVPGLAVPPIGAIQPAWVMTGTPGASGSLGTVGGYITGLTSGVPYAWQMRALAKSVFFPTGIWRSPTLSGRLETDLRAPGTWVDVAQTARPATLMLANVHPNPMRASTSIAFSLSRPGPVSLDVVDVQGRRVRTLARGTRTAGEHRIDWDGRGEDGRPVGAGIYFIRLDAESHSLNRKVAVMR